MFGFPKPVLEAYREAVDDDKRGTALQAAIDSVLAHGDIYSLAGSEQYKKVPRGYDKDHPRADLLKYKGLWVHSVDIPLETVQSVDFDDYCFEHLRRRNMAPIQEWLADLLRNVG